LIFPFGGEVLMIDRREFVGFVAANSLLLTPQLASGKTAGKTYRVGVLTPGPADADDTEWNEFVAELARRGYVNGRNLAFEQRYFDNVRLEHLDELATDLVQSRVDVIYCRGGTAAALAAKRATSTVPIVFFGSADPVSLGLVASLAHPGGNVTGSSLMNDGTYPKALQYLAEATGGLHGVAFVHPLGTRSLPWYPVFVRSLSIAAGALGATVHFVDVQSFEDLEQSVKRFKSQGIDGAMLIGDVGLVAPLKQIAGLFVDYRVPSVGPPTEGFLLECQPPVGPLARTSAKFVDRILQGVKPSDLPVEQVTTVELVINLRTAKALDLRIPQALLTRADKAIR
jgi:putative ABC transport system substrate-binding protein